MVERVALIFAQWGDAFSTHYSQPNSEMGWDDYSPTEQLIALAATRAVIEALTEPTPEMLASGAGELRRFDRDREFSDVGASAVFLAMLRTALSQPNDEGDRS